MTKMTFASLLSVVVAVALSSTVSGVKDSNFYYHGFVNPNTENEMYWKDSVNVLQDLDQFSALYIKHHGCVYSMYDHASAEAGGNEDNNPVCGGNSQGETDYWYLGNTPCFKANSAFSLYGILKTSSQGKNDGSYCHISTYIDTYFTTSGVETVGYAMGLIDYEGNGGNDDNDDNDNDDNGDNDDNDNNEYSPSSFCYGVNPNGDDNYDANYQDDEGRFYDYSGWTSYGTGCKNGDYVYDKFDGAFCKGANVLETVDTFDTFNQGIGNLECAQIYGEDEEDNSSNPAIGSSLGILRYSRSCSLRSYPNQCPDPYGLKIQYVKNLERALATKSSQMLGASSIEKALKAFSWIFLVVGILLLLSTCFIRRKATRVIKGSSKDEVLAARAQEGSMHQVFLATVSSSVSQISKTVKERIQNYCEEEEPAQIHDAPEAFCVPTSAEEGSYVQPAPVEDDNVKVSSPEENAATVASRAIPVLVETGIASLSQVCAPTSVEEGSYVQPASVEDDNVKVGSPEENAAPVASSAIPMLFETGIASLSPVCAPTSAEGGSYVQPAPVDDDRVKMSSPEENSAPASRASPMLVETGIAFLSPVLPIKKKRPRLAKLSKRLFGSKTKSSQASI